MTSRILHEARFPPISYPAWRHSLATVHRFAQVIGKIRLAARPSSSRSRTSTARRRSMQASGGGWMPTSPSTKASGSFSSRRLAHRPRSSSARTSPPPSPARQASIWSSRTSWPSRAQLLDRSVDVNEVFHPGVLGAQLAPADGGGRVAGPADDRASYSSFATFSDPDGNGWLLQEITTRLPGRVDPAETRYTSAEDLERALVRAAAAHGEHEKRTGRADEKWPEWYAAYMVAERTGGELPQ